MIFVGGVGVLLVEARISVMSNVLVTLEGVTKKLLAGGHCGRLEDR